jgi:hypothetical protein
MRVQQFGRPQQYGRHRLSYLFIIENGRATMTADVKPRSAFGLALLLVATFFVPGGVTFLPSLIAWYRRHHQRLAILMVSIFSRGSGDRQRGQSAMTASVSPAGGPARPAPGAPV